MTTTITLRHLFKGSATGRETKHRVSSGDGVVRVWRRETAAAGAGWGAHVVLTPSAAKRLGVVKLHGELYAVPSRLMTEGFLDVEVRP